MVITSKITVFELVSTNAKSESRTGGSAEMEDGRAEKESGAKCQNPKRNVDCNR